MEIKNGKKPLSSKPRPQTTTLDDIFGNTLGISAEIENALQAKGLEYRWIGYKKFVDMGGSHDRAWNPIKRKDCGMMDSSLNGIDPDGFVRRGDLVLAVRPKELGDRHRSVLRQDAANYTHNRVQKRQAEELNKFAETQGMNVKFTEGYGEDEE